MAPLTEFYNDAQRGTLPSYAWINPRAGMNVTTGQGSNDQHPDHDVALGEALIKDIYEALRASPQWNETLFVITYDEHGGFYDHVTPPQAPPPGGVHESYPDAGYNFSSLGVRIPTVLVSPWIAKGTVLSAPPREQRPQPDSEYDLTSIMATTRKLLGMPATPLTKRDAWAGTFEHLLMARDAPRTDCLTHLPAAPKPALAAADEAALPLNDLQMEIAGVHAHVVGGRNASEDVAIFLGGGTSQQDVSKWLQERYKTHAGNTYAWQRSKAAGGSSGGSGGSSSPAPAAAPAAAAASTAAAAAAATLRVISQPPSMKDWYGIFQINFGGSGGGKSDVQTISVKAKPTAKESKGDGAASVVGANEFCLEWQNTSVHVGYSNCYPSSDPSTNRDKDQQWVAHDDATVRPARHPTMCLTNVRMSPEYKYVPPPSALAPSTYFCELEDADGVRQLAYTEVDALHPCPLSLSLSLVTMTHQYDSSRICERGRRTPSVPTRFGIKLPHLC